MKLIRLNAKTPIRTWLTRLRRTASAPAGVEKTVRAVLEAVRRHGDAAVLRYSREFDQVRLTANRLRIRPDRIKEAYRQVSPTAVESLRFAADRIRSFHERQKPKSWNYEEQQITLGQLVRPLDRAGIYVPGGKAAYPSSVLMNAIPAKVAGVPEIVMCTPIPRGEMNPHLLVAADLAGVDEIYTVGGAQAIGAMAYGTKTIARVDKIVGPGNIYVATAKRLVFGLVDIDMIAGPSEIVVIADDTADPSFVAADLLSQAEHDELAISILITSSDSLIRKVRIQMKEQIERLPRKKIIAQSLRRSGKIFRVNDLSQAVAIANAIAPEHLELAVDQPDRLLPMVKHAGAVFLGHYTTESLGDYVAGPNHVLPTGGTARFSSPLSVDDFVKKTSLLAFSREGLSRVKDAAVRIAEMEGLRAHARAVEVRTQ
ncbi:MAG TPA: histidinol dehydrogenase [Nitrospiria bacterium]|nr:histidinol dehydrogenase [Nitrospiria bacterium]